MHGGIWSCAVAAHLRTYCPVWTTQNVKEINSHVLRTIATPWNLKETYSPCIKDNTQMWKRPIAYKCTLASHMHTQDNTYYVHCESDISDKTNLTHARWSENPSQSQKLGHICWQYTICYLRAPWSKRQQGFWTIQAGTFLRARFTRIPQPDERSLTLTEICTEHTSLQLKWHNVITGLNCHVNCS